MRRLGAAVLLLGAAALLLWGAQAWIVRSELERPLSVRSGGSAAPDFASASAGADSSVLRVVQGVGYFRVIAGEGFDRIASRLSRAGLIRRPRVVRFAVRREGWDRRVIPGWYLYRSGERERDLLARMARGEIAEARLTIPEGWSLRRILPAVADSAWVKEDSLRALAADEEWLAEREVPGPTLEGYLFPETYRLPRGESPGLLLEQMLRPGVDLWADSLREQATALGLDRRRLWTLASIIEAEAAKEDERRRISAVFWNRLRRGMRLESDPTVQFALDRPPGRVLYRDLEVDSPYNTYRVSGLPPGPICSPGRASLWAALQPEPGCRDLFFVARGDGSHVFSRSLAEHEAARRRIRRSNRR